MTDVAESTAPKAHARIAYLGPVSPHWEVYGDWGDRQTLDEFRARVLARLVLLPREDPQFRRNRERVVRDAERELITIEWDLGVVTAQPSSDAAAAGAAASAATAGSDSESESVSESRSESDGSGETGESGPIDDATADADVDSTDPDDDPAAVRVDDSVATTTTDND